MNLNEISRYYAERFVDPSSSNRGQATYDLANMGTDGVPIIRAILSGGAVDDRGHQLRADTNVVRCALISTRLLGEKSRALESLIRQELQSESSAVSCEATLALSSLGNISHESVLSLIAAVGDTDPGFEAAVALLRLKLESHPSVAGLTASSPNADRTFARARSFLKTDTRI